MVSKEIEAAIDGFVDSIRNVDDAECVGRNAYAESLKQLSEKRAALIALLARDDARIARLEDVAKCAKEIDEYGTHVHYRNDLRNALQALAGLADADAPGGG